MTEQDNFILRWARLKRGLTTEPGLRGNSSPSGSPEEVSVDAKAADAQPRADATADDPFDLASLPSIESIAPDTDLSAFLKSAVPAELTRAALRRAWESDPAVRDFVGIAENQWDFNNPDAIPGFGPLCATDSEPAVQFSGKFETIREALPQTPASIACVESRAANPDHADQDAQLTPDEESSADPGTHRPSEEISQARAETEGARAVKEYEAPRNLRRHGSALPH